MLGSALSGQQSCFFPSDDDETKVSIFYSVKDIYNHFLTVCSDSKEVITRLRMTVYVNHNTEHNKPLDKSTAGVKDITKQFLTVHSNKKFVLDSACSRRLRTYFLVV